MLLSTIFFLTIHEANHEPGEPVDFAGMDATLGRPWNQLVQRNDVPARQLLEREERREAGCVLAIWTGDQSGSALVARRYSVRNGGTLLTSMSKMRTRTFFALAAAMRAKRIAALPIHRRGAISASLTQTLGLLDF